MATFTTMSAVSQGMENSPATRLNIYERVDTGGSRWRLPRIKMRLKISRSKGHVVLMSTLKERGIDPMAYRYLLLTAHYRSKLNFTDESIIAAQHGLNNLKDDLAELPVPESSDGLNTAWSEKALLVRGAFHTAINDDLDLPTALSITREVARDNTIAAGVWRRQ